MEFKDFGEDICKLLHSLSPGESWHSSHICDLEEKIHQITFTKEDKSYSVWVKTDNDYKILEASKLIPVVENGYVVDNIEEKIL